MAAGRHSGDPSQIPEIIKQARKRWRLRMTLRGIASVGLLGLVGFLFFTFGL